MQINSLKIEPQKFAFFCVLGILITEQFIISRIQKMKTVQEQMQDFAKLTLEEKKKVVFDVVKWIKDVNKDTKYLYETLPTLKTIDDELLTIIYKNIAEVSDQMSQWMKVTEIKNIDIMRAKIHRIQELEALDRAKENPDDLLKNL